MVPLITRGCDEVGTACNPTGSPWAVLVPVLIPIPVPERGGPEREGRDMGRRGLQSMRENLNLAVTEVYGSHQTKWMLEGGKGLHRTSSMSETIASSLLPHPGELALL